MKYIMAIFADYDAQPGDAFPDAWRAYVRALVSAGVFVDGRGLQHPATATTVRLQSGKRLVQDGPFTHSREQLGGYIVVDLPSMHDALDWAARCPAAAYGTIEVRPLVAESPRTA